MQILDDIGTFPKKGKSQEVKELVQAALDQSIPAKTVLGDGLMTGMAAVGGKFKRNEVSVPEALIAARAMNAGAAIRKPRFASDGAKAEGKGLEAVDLGVDVRADKFVAAVREHRPQILMLSALLTTTMGEMKAVVDPVEGAGLRGSVKIMVGAYLCREDHRGLVLEPCRTRLGGEGIAHFAQGPMIVPLNTPRATRP